MFTRVLGLLLIATVAWVVGAVPVWASVAAPGFDEGPRITDGGLLWQGAPSGRGGVYLSTPTSTTLVSSSADLSEVAVEDGWVLAKNPRGPLIGRIGLPLRPMRVLRRCPPLGLEPERGGVQTVANGSLYTVVRAGCLDRIPKQGQLVVQVRLGTDKLRVIGMAPVPQAASTVGSIAIAGSWLALTYFQQSRRRIEVLSARDARLHYRLTAPRESGPSGDVQIDEKGDVLLTGSFSIPLDPTAEGWWADPRTRTWHALSREPFLAALSDGQIAYASTDAPFFEGETQGTIEILNLRTGRARALVSYSGSTRIEGMSFAHGVVAWANQNYEYALLEGGLPSEHCAGFSPSGPTELIETPTSAVGLPVAVTATPGPRPPGKTCIYL